jgi:hypothetical protein
MSTQQEIYMAGHRDIVGSDIVGQLHSSSVSPESSKLIKSSTLQTRRRSKFSSHQGIPSKSILLAPYIIQDQIIAAMPPSDLAEAKKNTRIKKIGCDVKMRVE